MPKFQLIINTIKCNNYVRIGEIVSFSKEITDFSEYPNETFEYLEISGVGIGNNRYHTSTTEVDKAPSRAKMKTKKGDIVVSTTRPHRGAIAEIVDDGIIASTGFSVIREVSPKINKKWLLYTLLSKFTLEQMLQRSSGGNYPAIIEDEIKQIYIPIIDMEKQIEIVNNIEKALLLRNDKLKKANDLLINKSNIILDKLGITFDIQNESFIYATTFSSISGRIDADFYSPKFVNFRNQIENSQYDVITIDDISEKIVSGFAAGKQDQADELPDERRVPHLRPFSITTEGELSFETQKYVPVDNLKDDDYCKKNEVIFNNTNSPDLVGKTTVFDADVLCAVSNHMTRITVKESINPYYISAFFNVLLSIGYWKLLCTNFNNQAGVNIDTLKSVRIPLPKKSVQDEIATEIMLRRSKANTLRREAEAEWKKAKEKFEKELLGE